MINKTDVKAYTGTDHRGSISTKDIYTFLAKDTQQYFTVEEIMGGAGLIDSRPALTKKGNKKQKFEDAVLGALKVKAALKGYSKTRKPFLEIGADKKGNVVFAITELGIARLAKLNATNTDENEEDADE